MTRQSLTSLESILHRDKIVPMRCLGHPKSTQKVVPGAFWGPPGRLRSSLEQSGVSSTCLGIIPGASQEYRESPPGRPEAPERVPRSAWERLGATKIDSEVPPEAEKTRFRCAPRSRTVFESCFQQFCRFSGLAKNARTLQSTSPASKNEGSAHRAAQRVTRTMLP